MFLKKSFVFIYVLLYNFTAGWLDERPTFESRNGNLFITSAKDKNITLKTLGIGNVNLNDINLLHALWAAQNASHLIERWKTGILDDVESTLTRLSHIIEGPDGLIRKINAIEYANETPLNASNTVRPTSETETDNTALATARFTSIRNRLRRLEIKVRSISIKLRTNECELDPCQNGGTCIDSYDSFQCHCPQQWEGTLCNVDVNECERYVGKSLGCQNGATCVNLPGTFSCTCAPGWHGFHCSTQKSVCDETTNTELCGHGVCVKTNSALGYTCICEPGWTRLGDNDPSCLRDVDECTVARYPCSVNPLVSCHNVPGTFYCGSCPPGYTGDGFKCQDIDECLVNNGGCSTIPAVECINTLGSRKCAACPSGYQGDGVSCFYVGSCSVNNGGCHSLASCALGINSQVICLCPPGYQGDGKGPQGCRIVDNACRSNPCLHGTCTPQGLSDFVCTCNEGFTGRTCSTSANPCIPNPCQNNGVCRVASGKRFCECSASFSGPTCSKPRQACGGYFRNPNGYVEYPVGTGNKYDHDVSCAWVIITNQTMVLNITFTKFALEYSRNGNECNNDYVQIHDGKSAGSHIIGRYCGERLPNNGTIISTHNAIYIWFHSDASVNREGFAFNWTTIAPVCGGAIDAEHGSISSPGYPGKYPVNRDCYWTVSTSPGKRITFHFISLMLEEHINCDYDYVEISEKTYIGQHTIGRFCNHSDPAPLTTTGPKATVHFHSDNSGTDSGFHLSFLSVAGSPDCGGIFTGETGEITSPGYSSGSYRQDMICEWEIRLPAGSEVRINWLNFDIERSRNCMFDSLQIYQGPDMNSPLVGKYCGSTLPAPVSVKSNRVLVRFESDANMEEKGFRLKYEIECGGTFTDPSGIIKSPYYPNPYPTSKECVYLIAQPPGKAVVLTFEFMDIEEGFAFDSKQSSCYFDRIEIRDGDTENSTLIKQVCGSIHNMPTEPIFSTHNYMFVKFFTDASISNLGFKANYTTVDRECGGIIRQAPGTLNIPGIPVSWNNNLNCSWTIHAPAKHIIQLTWIAITSQSTGVTEECRRNYIELFEDYRSKDSKSLGKYCSNKAPPQIMTSQGNDLTITYHSTGDSSENLYQAAFVFLNDSHSCGGHYYTREGSIKSPNYPEKYPKNKECVWIIEAENKYLVSLEFRRFDLEDSPTCLYDYLEIRSGSTENSPLLGKYCGSRQGTEITSMTNQMYIKFVSDASSQARGFDLQWNNMKGGCGGDLYASSGSIISPNYPQNYYHRAACTWNIRVSAGSIVRMTFTDFEVEDHIKCRFDYLEISDVVNGYSQNSARYCGSNSPSLLLSQTNHVKLYFRTDVLTNARGFHLRYTTDCNNKVSGFRGVIESPNFPEDYENSNNCTWIISVPAGNSVNITFSHFNVQGGSSDDGSCEHDYVQIQEGEFDQPNTELLKKCGQEEDVLPLKVSSIQRQVFVSFVTDAFSRASGFRLEWYINGCSEHLTKPTGEFFSPGYPNGNKFPHSFVECQWLIEVDFDKSIEITFPKIENTRSHACYDIDNNGSIEIFNGPNELSPQLSHKLCYSDKPVVLTSTGNQMLIKYGSETSYSSHGFRATYRSVNLKCGGKFMAQSGVIHSTNYPNNYPANENCEWLIIVDPNHAVNLTFVDLDLEKSRNCSDDYIKVYDGNSTEAPLLGIHCQSSQVLPFYVSTGNELLVQMKSDALVAAKGFMAVFNRTCGARITVTDFGSIQSSPTLHSMTSYNCSWIIVAEDSSDKITLIFNHIDLQAQDCSLKSIEIFEGEGLDGPMLGQLCTNKIPKPFYSTGNALTVHLTTSFENTAGDIFDATYSTFSTACGGKYTAERGVIATPNHPLSYPSNADCTWTIQNSPGNRISLTFETFELSESENCNVDYLEIRENNGIGKLRGIFCGKNVESISSSETLWIRFKSSSNSIGNPTGFMAEYSLLFGNELTGSEGELASPMYPLPYRSSISFSWRITVDFNFVIKLQFSDFHFDSFEEYCYSSLKIYDGFDDEAPLINELCGISVPSEPITSSSNIIYITMDNAYDHVGNWFLLKWVKVPRASSTGQSEEISTSKNSETIILTEQNKTYSFQSPGYPNGYEDSLQYSWTFVSPQGTHMVLRFTKMSLEESDGCIADYVAIYNGRITSFESNENLLNKLCLPNATSSSYVLTNVATVQFVSDSYRNKSGFAALVVTECGGLIEETSGTIRLNNTSRQMPRSLPYVYSCEWIVKVRPGRRIRVNVEKNNIESNQPKTNDNSCRTNYLMLKNGESSNSPLLGTGKYCSGDKPSVQNTTSNYLYVKLAISFATVDFKLTFRELGHDCGGRFYVSARNESSLMELHDVMSPNYPNIPTPHTECIWTFMSVDTHRLSIHFVDRFDLAFDPDCEQEYVEVRDGGTDSAPLLGRFCKNTLPSTLSSRGNMLYVHYFTDIPEPHNGFSAFITSGEICGGFERSTQSGVITSPNYPETYNTKSHECSWWISGPSSNRGIKIQFEDLSLPSTANCSSNSGSDRVTIYEKIPGFFNKTEIGTYCGSRKPGVIDVLTKEAVIEFKSTFSASRLPILTRGFRLNYTFDTNGCGGTLRGLSGEFQTTGYPKPSNYKYCYWKIFVPEGYRVVVDVIDLDLSSNKYSLGSHVSFHHDPQSLAPIVVLKNTSQSMRVSSSSNYMSVYYISAGGHRGMKAKFTAEAPAACGGVLEGWEGTFTSPQLAPFNESTFYCKWIVRRPKGLDARSKIQSPLTISYTVSGVVSTGTARTTCTNYLTYLAIKGDTPVARICGNMTSKAITVTSPYSSYTIEALNSTHKSLGNINFTVNYKWHECGGILSRGAQFIESPKNITYPVHCAWRIQYPDNDDTITVSFESMNLGPCDKSYVHIKGATFKSPSLGKFCGNVKPQNIVSPSNAITIEYYAAEYSGDFKILLNYADNACGGLVRGKRTEIKSPGFPQSYKNNIECIWEIVANPGYHVGLTFVERFNIETSKDCQNDYVEILEWKEDNQNASDHWKSLTKVCGRDPPKGAVNSTTNKMMVKFVTNDKIEGDGFKAVWNPNCGGVYQVTSNARYIESPNYRSPVYPPRTFCNYTFIAPGEQEIIVDFENFELEGNSATCPFDNLTIYSFVGDWLRDTSTWCGYDSPGRKIAKGRMEIIFRTDSSVNRDGFKFKYFLNDCGGVITTPRIISPLVDTDPESYSWLSCIWVAQAPPNKSVLLRFEQFHMSQPYGSCISNFARVFEGNTTNMEKAKGTFCGNLDNNLPVVQSQGNIMTIAFYVGSYGGNDFSWKAAVLFVNGPEQGCGGNVNVTKVTEFKTQLTEFYEPFQDCHWIINAPQGYNIEFTIEKMDLRNSTFNDSIVNGRMACDGDFIEVRDGGPYAELIGLYCGSFIPAPMRSTANLLWIRFVSDGMSEGRGAQGKLKATLSPCGITDLSVENEAKVLTSPNYPNGYPSDITCRWTLHLGPNGMKRVRLVFKQFNLTDSEKCETEYLQIADLDNRQIISEGFGEQLIIGGTKTTTDVLQASHVPHSFYRYCGSNLPHDYLSGYKDVEIIYKASSRSSVENEGFKVEYSSATCSQNYTALQGRIVHDDVSDCWVTVEVPENYTISMYFNSFSFPGSSDCSRGAVKIYDGTFDGHLIQTVCNYEMPNPVFSTKNRLSFHAYSKRLPMYQSAVYDITYTSTPDGRGCGGQLYNYGGTFTSPMYPNPYRNRSACVWDVSVPRGMKILLRFTTFDIGLKSMCSTDYLTISEELADDEEDVSLTYCGGDTPADYESKHSRIFVSYYTSINNGGSGWIAQFSAVQTIKSV